MSENTCSSCGPTQRPLKVNNRNEVRCDLCIGPDSPFQWKPVMGWPIECRHGVISGYCPECAEEPTQLAEEEKGICPECGTAMHKEVEEEWAECCHECAYRKLSDLQRKLAKFEELFRWEHAATCFDHTDQERLHSGCPVCLRTRADPAEKELRKFQERNTHWGPSVVPESLKALYAEQSDAGRDFRLIIEDRRVTDLSADYWMKEARERGTAKDLAEARVKELEKRIGPVDPGGSDKIDELESAVEFLKHELSTKDATVKGLEDALLPLVQIANGWVESLDELPDNAGIYYDDLNRSYYAGQLRQARAALTKGDIEHADDCMCHLCLPGTKGESK
jgi:hypothetical protein